MDAQIPANVPSHWTTYFAVTNCDKSVAQIEKLGGKILMPARDIPNVGRFAVCNDPQGAKFAILQPASK
jgi:predicted enzyme related to lactoylglutathione lyase